MTTIAGQSYADYHKAYRTKHKERFAAQRKARAGKEAARKLEYKRDPTNWATVMLHAARSRSKKFGIEYDIDADDIVVPDTCPVLNIPLFIIGGRQTANSPSLDRIDNSKGYVKGNVKVISNRANLLKKDATLKELQALCRYMESVKSQL